MVIKDNEGKVIILLDQNDILNYVFEKCGFEVGVVIKDMTEEAEETDEDLEFDLREANEENARLENENQDLNRRNEDLEENNATLERVNEDLKSSLETTRKAYKDLQKQHKVQKDIYMEHLKSKGLAFAADILKNFDE